MTRNIPVTHDASTGQIRYDARFVQPSTPMRNGRWKIRLRGERALARRRMRRAASGTGIPFKVFLRRAASRGAEHVQEAASP